MRGQWRAVTDTEAQLPPQEPSAGSERAGQARPEVRRAPDWWPALAARPFEAAGTVDELAAASSRAPVHGWHPPCTIVLCTCGVADGNPYGTVLRALLAFVLSHKINQLSQYSACTPPPPTAHLLPSWTRLLTRAPISHCLCHSVAFQGCPCSC